MTFSIFSGRRPRVLFVFGRALPSTDGRVCFWCFGLWRGCLEEQTLWIFTVFELTLPIESDLWRSRCYAYLQCSSSLRLRKVICGGVDCYIFIVFELALPIERDLWRSSLCCSSSLSRLKVICGGIHFMHIYSDRAQFAY